MALDLARDCLVLGMLLRDDTSGTTHHRQGGTENETAGLIGALVVGDTAEEIGAYILGLATLYVRLVQRWGLKPPDPAPLAALIGKITQG